MRQLAREQTPSQFTGLHVEQEFVLNPTSLAEIVTYIFPDAVLSEAMILPLPLKSDSRYQLQYPEFDDA